MVSSDVEIVTPRWFEPLLQPSRYKGAFGGRGGGKSQAFAEALVELHVIHPDLSSVCLREVQRSIKLSVKRLIELKIQQIGVGSLFDVQDTIIKRRGGSGLIVFQGMQNHTSDSIKSLESFDVAWFEEAQNASQLSLDLLRPTLRVGGVFQQSELWFTWNPRNVDDPIDVLLRSDDPPPSSTLVEVNYPDNPWFPDVLRDEMEYDRRRDPDKYEHVWLGGYEQHSESRVFHNWVIEEFDTPPDAMFRFGADWGFSVDPTVLVRSYKVGRKLFIDYEAYRVGCEIMDTPALFMEVPESERWPIVADSSRPETISHMRDNGYPKITKAVKGKNSLVEGVEWLKTHEIVIHPRCKHVIDEFSSYRYKVDSKTGAVLPILEDDNNHVIDAIRYSEESDRRATKADAARQKTRSVEPLPSARKW